MLLPRDTLNDGRELNFETWQTKIVDSHKILANTPVPIWDEFKD
jgi:hypothetical protein